jgi:hypothetical protein
MDLEEYGTFVEKLLCVMQYNGRIAI